MFSRLIPLSALALVLAVPAARADDKKADAKTGEPALLVRVQAINDLLKTAEYVRTLLPGEQGDQFELGYKALEAFIDKDKGSIEGIDVKNPIGLYLTFGEELNLTTPPAVLLVPIADQEAVLAALKERAKLTVEKEKDDVYKIPELPNIPLPVYFRFANKYAYVTLGDPQNIDPKALPKPADVLGGRPEHLVSITFRIDRLPDAMRKMALAQIENALAQGKDQPLPNETKAVKEFKEKGIDELATNLKELLDSGEQVAIRLNVDAKAEEVAFEFELSGKKGSKLAKDIMSIREHKSVVGGALASKDAALTVNLSVGLPANLKSLLPPVVDDLLEQVKKQGTVPGEIQAKAEPLVKALLPTVKAGELDLGVSMVGPDKDEHYTVVAGLKLVDGKKLEAALKDAAKKDLPPEFSGLVQFDAEKLAGGASLHTVKIADQIDEKAQKVLGKSDLYLAFRDDLLVMAVGPNAKDALKRAIASQPADVGVFNFQVSLSRIVPIMGDNAQELAAAKAAAEKVFGKGGSQADTIRFSIEGGDSLKVKAAAKGKAIRFLAEVGANQQKKDQ
jgi:predicted RNA-binding protein YlqC (UPF0109 family)